MFDIFTTREVALALYFSLITIWIFLNQKTRVSAFGVIKIACGHQLRRPFVFILCYAAIIIYFLTLLSFWKWIYFKDIAMWVIFIGVPICYKAVNTQDEYYFKNVLISNFKFSALLSFISGTLTFSFLAELLLQPILTFLFILQAFAERNTQYAPAKRFVDCLIAFIGFVVMYFTIKKAIVNYSQMEFIDTIVKFTIPILFSVLYLPIAYSIAVYAKYQVLFCRMKFTMPKDKLIERKRKRAIMKVCKLSYKKVNLFEREYARRLYVLMKDEEFYSIIDTFRKAAKNE